MGYNSYIKVKNSSNSFDSIFPITKSQNVVVDEATDKRLDELLTEINTALANKLESSLAGVANGLATLDSNGFVPLTQLPPQVKEMKVVADITARDAIVTKYSGLSVFVQDASDDPTVNSGGAYYIYNGTTFIKVAEAESLDVTLDWTEMINKPTTLSGYGITDAVNSSEVSTTAAPNKLIKTDSNGDMPVSVTGNAATASKLKTSRTISISGDASGSVSFDGSKNADITLTLDDSGAVAGTYTKVTVDSKGRVTTGNTLIADDIPSLDWSKITTGTPTTLDGYGITDGVNKAGDTMTGALTLSADPTNPLHAATKQYVDNAVQGLDAKGAARVATTENITLSGLQTIDGVALAVGDRVLVKDQTNAVENGIYIVAETDWTRSLDFDGSPSNEVEGGEYVFVSEGSNNHDTGWVVVTDAPIEVGTDEIEFTQFSGAGQIIAGTGLTKSGNTISLANTGITTGTYTKVTVDAQGRITTGTDLSASDIPSLDWSKITTGTPTTLDGYGITDGVNKAGDTMTGALTLSADPTNPLHAATKQYVDNAVQGLDAKGAARVATTENITLSGLQTIDGVALAVGDRVLVKDQTNAVENGIYIVAETDWTRSLDFDGSPSNEVEGGEYVFVSEGSNNHDTGWVVVTDAPIEVGTDEIEFTQFSGAGQIIAGTGLTKSGNTISLANTGITTGTYTKVTVDAQGRITTGTDLSASDIPSLDWSKITTGKPSSAVDDIDEAVTLRHSHTNKTVLDKFTEASGRVSFDGNELAYKNEANNTVVSATEPTTLPVNGIWFQTV